MKLLVFVIFVLTFGLYQINAGILKQQKESKKGKGRYYPPNFYKVKIILLVLNLSPISSLITAISLFFISEWWVASSVIIITVLTRKLWAKFSEHAVLHPLYYFFGRK